MKQFKTHKVKESEHGDQWFVTSTSESEGPELILSVHYSKEDAEKKMEHFRLVRRIKAEEVEDRSVPFAQH